MHGHRLAGGMKMFFLTYRDLVNESLHQQEIVIGNSAVTWDQHNTNSYIGKLGL